MLGNSQVIGTLRNLLLQNRHPDTIILWLVLRSQSKSDAQTGLLSFLILQNFPAATPSGATAGRSAGGNLINLAR